MATTTANQPFVADAIAIMAKTGKGQPPRAERLDIMVEGEPEVQERPRMSNLGHVHMYDPSSKLKGKYRWAVLKALKGLQLGTYPVFSGELSEVRITVVFHVNNMLKDVDNLLKFVLDALETIVYANDRTVLQIVADKHYSPGHGFTTIAVEVMHPVHNIE